MDIETIKSLREETGAGIMDVKKALAQTNGNREEALHILSQKGLAKAEKRADREATEGIIYSYIHLGGSVGVLIELNCETSFVAKTEEFSLLAREICLQIASMKPEHVEELLEQDYVRDTSKKVSDLIATLTAKTGEKISLKNFTRYGLGE
ncbi:translation elongation factor Ts [candidate division WWE3 bacterium CG_4_9_14_3_um_filter_41_6]|uniref:Elongation factor Ts n=1 Tax=candidate division WWE3 bacterium CG_4_10_14_0_2_um_filter_41_14 TaxID=1975072 RepID=A0A2M7TEM7_UNCKA|nr:MAG: translation elongation factor Ts [candidate division WWE3 bacterium CG_4_10_14_0_2_um_filter_41_14]PJA39086.1 MAG: translation elongation factor Ts [candidate division WWE3 bacterium CG_4_9_14_3_um_filter_41_6]